MSPGPAADPGYLSLPELARYAGVSRRTLQGFLSDPIDPLPFIVYPGMTDKRIKRSDFDTWADRYRRRGTQDAAAVDQVVADVLGRRPVTGQTGRASRPGCRGARASSAHRCPTSS